jgi:hypothetical protein
MTMNAFDVFLNGKKIDRVFYVNIGESTEEQTESVRRSLISHDGYDPGITVRMLK